MTGKQIPPFLAPLCRKYTGHLAGKIFSFFGLKLIETEMIWNSIFQIQIPKSREYICFLGYKPLVLKLRPSLANWLATLLALRVTVLLPFSQIRLLIHRRDCRKDPGRMSCPFCTSFFPPEGLHQEDTFCRLPLLPLFVSGGISGEGMFKKAGLPDFMYTLVPSHCPASPQSAFTCSLTILAVPFLRCLVSSIPSKQVLTTPLSLWVPACLLM